MKKEYKRPELVEYGTLQQLTLGQTGNSPDAALWNGILINVNNVCDPTKPHPGLVCS